MEKIKISAYLIAIILLISSCGGKKENQSTTNEPKEEIVDAVCLFDKLSVREEPSKDAKWLSGLNLGEVAKYLGESVVDSADNNREYMKVELTDGTIGWSVTYGLAKDAQAAAIIEDAVVFERPDLVTKTQKSYIPVEFVAITDAKDDWIEVIGKGRKKSGWIQSGVVSKNEKDVAVATLAAKAELIDSQGVKTDQIDDFLADLPIDDCHLVTYLKSIKKESDEEIKQVDEIGSDSLTALNK